MLVGVYQMQITVVGSQDDLYYREDVADLATELGKEIARRGHILVYGTEVDCNSLPCVAAQGARSEGGITVAIADGKAHSGFYCSDAASVVVYTDASIGGSREVVLANSSNAIISISGGAGTLTEIVVAYRNYIPIIAMEGTGGWSDKLAGQYLDSRKKVKVRTAKTAKEALDKIEDLMKRPDKGVKKR